MAGRASIVGAAETSVGNVRDHNEDSHFIDTELGIFLVCDGMGGHAAGEVASAIAVQTIRTEWASNETQRTADRWLSYGTPSAHKELLGSVVQGVLRAHQAIVAESEADTSKGGMGTTLIGAMVVGGDVVFAHCGDSRAYLVRDGIAMQLTEDQTLLARLLAAGVDVDVNGEGARFKSMLTNAVGIGVECKVATFVVPLADGDRFLLCSDGVTEYIEENEIGEVLCRMPSPARAAQRLVELALERGGADNATALVVRVLEAGETARSSEAIKREDLAIHKCPLWARANPQQRLRALRIALPRDYPAGERLPAQTLGDRVAWIIVEGELDEGGSLRGPGSLVYPQALLFDSPLPDKDGLAVTESDVRALALRADDFRELCDDDTDLGEVLLAALAAEIALRTPQLRTSRIAVPEPGFTPTPLDVNERGSTDPGIAERPRKITDRGLAVPERPPEPPSAAPEPVSPAPAAPPPEPQVVVKPKSRLIAAPTEVEGDLDRAMMDMQTEDTAKQLEPADDEDAEIVVEAERAPSPAVVAKPSAPRPHDLSEPEIEIETLEAAAEEDQEEVRALEVDEPAELEDVHELEADEPGAQEEVHEIEADEPGAQEEVRELEADEPGAQEEVRELEADEPGAQEEVHEIEADEPADQEIAEARAAFAIGTLETEAAKPPTTTKLEDAADEAPDLVDREWEKDEHSEVNAAEAIRVLEQEEQAERVVAELESEEPVSARVEVGELDDEPDDGRVIEVLKDTSSQTITMTMSDEQAAAQPKRQTD